jgi:PAT family beta-lactamase induction signal transducer AmpG
VFALLRKKIFARMTRNPDSFYSKAFASFMAQPNIGTILAFIILLRTGEFMLSSMSTPFLIDLGLKKQLPAILGTGPIPVIGWLSGFGFITGFFGIVCSIGGAMTGSLLITKFGLNKCMWPFLLAQNFTNLVYMFLANSLSVFLTANTLSDTPVPLGIMNFFSVTMVHGFDQFSGGLGTAVLMTYLMRICNAEFKAAHYAIGSGLMSLTGVLTGVVSGFITAQIGYSLFFGLSFIMSLPGMVLAFFVPKK